MRRIDLVGQEKGNDRKILLGNQKKLKDLVVNGIMY
jgi:hypothetical protein